MSPLTGVVVVVDGDSAVRCPLNLLACWRAEEGLAFPLPHHHPTDISVALSEREIVVMIGRGVNPPASQHQQATIHQHKK
jgi:hypothetical protein